MESRMRWQYLWELDSDKNTSLLMGERRLLTAGTDSYRNEVKWIRLLSLLKNKLKIP